VAIIDVQVHCYERNHPGRPWAGHIAGPDHVTGDEMVAAMDAVGVDGAILVSPFALYRFDASYALEVHAAHPTRFGLIKPVDTANPGVADVVADWAATKGTVGIRIMLNNALSSDTADPGINRTLAAADIWPPVLDIINAFGIDRCMWGPDWTRATELLTYEQGVQPIRSTERLSKDDKAKLMGGTLEKVYKWAPV
jgi:predicted TIM-barrel fold metal-dependent hydrolase